MAAIPAIAAAKGDAGDREMNFTVLAADTPTAHRLEGLSPGCFYREAVGTRRCYKYKYLRTL